MSETDTPRTDALVAEIGDAIEHQPWDNNVLYFARQLERELALAKVELLGTQKINAELRELIEQQKSQVAELEKDAARYRWLRKTLPMTIGQVLKWPYYPAQYDYNIFDAKIDAAIEAALKEPQ